MRMCTTLAPFALAGLLAAPAVLTAPGALVAQEVDAAAIDAVFADIEADMPGCAVGVYRALVAVGDGVHKMIRSSGGSPRCPTTSLPRPSGTLSTTRAAFATTSR